MFKSRKGKIMGVTAAVVSTLLLLSGCAGGANSAKGTQDGKQLVKIAREDLSTFAKNFNPFSPNSLPGTSFAIYEPLFIYTATNQKITPWLATSWKAQADGKGVTFNLREGVKWSDGQPFVAKDVVSTFKLDQKIKGSFPYVSDVTAVNDHTVKFTFNQPYVAPGLYEIGGHVIIPDHIFSKLAKPATDTNATPVGTGPYTTVKNFGTQSFDLTKNPNYWQPQNQKIEGIRMLAFNGNDSANLALQSGDIDWGDQFMPNIQKTFVDKNPAKNHYWFALTGSIINWQLNTTKAPFNDVNVRKALSMAIDRDQIVKIAMNNYTKPADCTGLSNAYASWKDQSLVSQCTWTKKDAAAAAALLDKAGYKKGSDGKRTLKDGKPFAFKISVGSASSDWLSVANVISQNLATIGVTATVNSPDWSAVVASYQDGSFDSGIVWANNAPTPYEFYRGIMSTTTVKKVGENTFDNYHRFGLAAADALLAKFAASGDLAEQHTIANQLQALYNENAPVIPLFTGPDWGAHTSTSFTGWPSEKDPYASLSARATSTLLVLTKLNPVKN